MFGFCSVARSETSNLPEAKVWAERGEGLWSLVTSRQPVSVPDGAGGRVTIPVAGFVDFQAPLVPGKVEVDAQMSPHFRTASGEVVKDDQRGLVDPLDGRGALQTGGTFLNRPLPLNYSESGKLLGLKVAQENNPNAKPYRRIGVRLPGTPAGRLLFLFEMTDAEGENPAWFAREFIAPLPGCPWMPTVDAMTGDKRKIHLRKLAVFVLEPWRDPAARIPARLSRGNLKIDFDAAAKAMNWEQLKEWMAANISDATVPADRPFVIQLPPGVINDADGFGISASKWSKWGKAVSELGEGRKVWLVGHPQTTIPWLRSSEMNNLGFLFCRFTRLADDGVTDPKAAKYDTMIQLDGEDMDFRNNWVECPDGVASGAIMLRRVVRCAILDNLLATSGAPITTPGSTRAVSTIIARNWMERGHDAFQLYGGWSDCIIAYNHAVSASGYANREANSWHLGANLHPDEFQSQANQTDLTPQTLYIFGNFFQFGRHNWPALWQEIGGGTQNFIIDGDAYKNTAIYWNVFQNLAPGGHRGIMSIGPDKDWALANPKHDQRNYIENLSIMGNAMLERLDNHNRPPYGYIRPAATIAGKIGPDYFELLNTENLYATANSDFMPALFKQTVDGRPDLAARQGWRAEVPTLADIYERPILYVGDVKNGYAADFSRTTYAGDKFLNGWVSPTDYAPKSDWSRARDGAARLTPLSQLQKIPDMPLKLADFLGDPARPGGFFDELTGTPITAKKTVLASSPWRAGSPDDGFLLHVKFRSVGTPGTWRELLSEKNGADSYRVALTKENTARFELYRQGEIVSRVESADTFKDGDHLTMQVYTPYFPSPPEHYYPYAMLSNVFAQGVRKIRYMASDKAPADFKPAADELYVWMDTSRLHRIFEWREQSWRPVLGALDSVHACAFRTFSPERDKPFNAPESTRSLRRDLYAVEAGRWHTLFLDGPGVNSTEVWANGDLRWVKEATNTGTVLRNDGGKAVGANNAFHVMPMASGRPRCFIRHNIDHSDKRWDWVWTPDVNLPRGEVTLFGGFDGSYESFRVIRGGQGEYGLPANTPGYRILESMASALAFIRPPLDQSGRVPGWGKPDIYLKAP